MNEQNPSTKPLVKIGELAKASGVSVSTLKFYVKEGLIRPALKTGRNMSWYDPDCTATIQAIRTLQRERFYPLSVIKRLLNSPTTGSSMELALLDAIHKADDKTIGCTVGISEAARRTHLSASQIRRLCEAGLISNKETGRRYAFSAFDLQVCHLIYMRMEVGIPFEQSVYAFSTYSGALRKAAQEDVTAFIRDAVLNPDFTAEIGTRRIRVSDETLDRFIDLKRKEYNREYGSEYLELLYRFSDALLSAVEQLRPILDRMALHEDARLCAAAAQGQPTGIEGLDECVRLYRNTTCDRDNDIAGSIAGAVLSREYFASLNAESTGAALCAHCLRLCWMNLAPDILACGDLAIQARLDFEAFLHQTMPGKGEALLAQIMELLNRTGGNL